MGYTEADAAADMADIEMRDAEDEKVRADLSKAKDRELLLRQEIEIEKFRLGFGEMASQLSPHDRFDYLVWLSLNLDAAEALNKSASRATICVALAGMPNYEVNDERDAGLDLPVGIGMLEAIMPPATDSTWGSYGRPQNFFHQITRMQGKVISGKNKGAPINLIKILWSERLPGKMGARFTQGYKLDSTGICYAHIHGKGKITKDDLYHYWLNSERGIEKPSATNPAYLSMIGEGPPVDTSPHRWNSSAYAWKCLDSLQREDTSVPERYKGVSAMKLSKTLVAVHKKDAVECLKFMDKDDQRRLFRDVMNHSNVGTSRYAQSKILGDLDGAKTYAAKIELLVELYGSEHEAPPDSTTVIEELICRCTWGVISQVMGHRVGDPAETTVDVATELMSHARSFEQMEALQQLVGDMSARIDIASGPARLG